MNENRDLSKIPAGACTLTVGEVEFGDNGEGAKSAPIRLVARSGKPIEHWFWGNVVHDLAGMQLHKSRLPIDYVHDANQVIGYLNKFDTESGDLVTSGALVPFKDSDRATEILHKTGAGVPYEASINFGGDGIKVQEIDEGELTEVNGYQFEGPGVVVREWPLRGVAICPYGADMNTETSAFSDNSKTFHASVVAELETNTEESLMSDAVDVADQTEAAIEEELEAKPETVEAPQAEAPESGDELSSDADEVALAQPQADESDDKPEAEPVEAELAEGEEAASEDESIHELTRDEFLRINSEFGADVAAETVKSGGTYEDALRASHDALKNENAELREKIAEFDAAKSGGPAAKVTPARKPASLFKTGK